VTASLLYKIYFVFPFGNAGLTFYFKLYVVYGLFIELNFVLCEQFVAISFLCVCLVSMDIRFCILKGVMCCVPYSMYLFVFFCIYISFLFSDFFYFMLFKTDVENVVK